MFTKPVSKLICCKCKTVGPEVEVLHYEAVVICRTEQPKNAEGWIFIRSYNSKPVEAGELLYLGCYGDKVFCTKCKG